MDITSSAFKFSTLDFYRMKGQTLGQRYDAHHDWWRQRKKAEVYGFARVLMGKSSNQTEFADTDGLNSKSYINFGSQDYLGLTMHPSISTAAKKAIDEHGVHSAGSAALAGRTKALIELEKRLALLLGKESCTVFPTGWAAGFGVITGMVRSTDQVVIDSLAHNCLFEGARHATDKITKFAHNNLQDLEAKLRFIRETSPNDPIFIVSETLFSMNSDSPDVAKLVEIAKQYQAITIIDIAHDFGSMNEHGFGGLEGLKKDEMPDFIMGSFSKTFCSNGGFVAAPGNTKEYFLFLTPTNTFSNALSPLQCAIVQQSIDIIFGSDGPQLRQKLADNVLQLRAGLENAGFAVGGSPSPIVPVFIGKEGPTRLLHKVILHKGLNVNMVEYPGVGRGNAMFRFQVMATHTTEMINEACRIMATSKKEVEELMG